VRMHSRLGADFLLRQPGMAAVHPQVRHHHERVDGSGYPRGLAGEAIPFGSRLIAIADSFDAMLSNRPYRQALGLAQARQRLTRGAGSQWDAVMVDLFLCTPLAVRGAHDVELKELYR
jgi:HD-GYP domain-containing protein (c-di-GMP phosphodiesterase class II)